MRYFETPAVEYIIREKTITATGPYRVPAVGCHSVTFSKVQYQSYVEGALIQDAFPHLTAEDREWMMTGYLTSRVGPDVSGGGDRMNVSHWIDRHLEPWMFKDAAIMQVRQLLIHTIARRREEVPREAELLKLLWEAEFESNSP